MDINWIGSPNYNKGRQGYSPKAIINHVMCGTEEGTDSWFLNTNSQVSAHFGIAKSGIIHQYVKEEDTAWANGRELSPDIDWLENFPNVNPNLWTISIEHEGYPNEPLTDLQKQATIDLHKYLVTKWNIPVDENHITGHFRIDSVNRKDCPSSTFPFEEIYSSLRGGNTMGNTTEKVMVNAGGKQIQGFIINGVSFVATREIAEALGHSIAYDSVNKIVDVK